LVALSSDLGCSTQVTPNGTGGRCETDDQCDRNQGLVCRCLRRKNPDEEGGDQIISAGYCQISTFACADTGTSEVGVTDTGVTDSAPADSGSEAAPSDAPSDSAPDSD
jgi:hypothetical protein